MKPTLILLIVASCCYSVLAQCKSAEEVSKEMMYGSRSDLNETLHQYSSNKDGIKAFLAMKTCSDQFTEARKKAMINTVEDIVNNC